MKTIFFFFTFTLFIFAQNVIVVDQAGGGNYLTITSAVNAANAGDTIKVMPGNYVETITISKKIHLLGIDTTVIITGPVGHTLTIASGAAGGSLLGLKFTMHVSVSANQFLVAGNIFSGYNFSAGSGILDLNFSNNTTYGGSFSFGMGAGNASVLGNKFNGSTVSASTSAKKCYVNENVFKTSPLNASSSGTGDMIVANNNFSTENTTTTHASIGSSPPNSKIIFINNNITGGAVGVQTGSSTIVGNRISQTATAAIRLGASNYEVNVFGNQLTNNNGGGFLSPTYSSSSSLTLKLYIANNIFSNNSQSSINLYGNTYSNYEQNPAIFIGKIYNNVINNNNATAIQMTSGWNHGWISGASNLQIKNNIIAFNSAAISASTSFSVQDYNCLFSNQNNNASGVGNIVANPMFVNPAVGDFHLSAGSPCIDVGSPDVSDYDLDRTRNDMGIYGGSYSWNNFNGATGNAKVTELLLSPQATAQGNTITITGSGAAIKNNQTQAIEGQKVKEVK